jgi:hypothetical protein
MKRLSILLIVAGFSFWVMILLRDSVKRDGFYHLTLITAKDSRSDVKVLTSLKGLESVSSEGSAFQNHSILEISRKVLLSEDEKSRLKDFLSDPRSLSQLITVLSTRESALDADKVRLRMDSVDLLTKMIQWKSNPLRNSAINEVVSLLRLPVKDSSNDVSVQKSFIGDRIELFVLLMVQDEQKANNLLKDLIGTPEESYFKFARSFYLRK